LLSPTLNSYLLCCIFFPDTGFRGALHCKVFCWCFHEGCDTYLTCFRLCMVVMETYSAEQHSELSVPLLPVCNLCYIFIQKVFPQDKWTIKLALQQRLLGFWMLKTFSTANVRKPFLWLQTQKQIDHFTDTAAILNSIVSNSSYGMPRRQISVYLPPKNPIIVIWNNGIQNGSRIGKKVFSLANQEEIFNHYDHVSRIGLPRWVCRLFLCTLNAHLICNFKAELTQASTYTDTMNSARVSISQWNNQSIKN